MNTITINGGFRGNAVVKSSDAMFDVSDFLHKYYRIAGRGRRFGGFYDDWKDFCRCNGFVGALHLLMDKYGVRNYQHFYLEMELQNGELLAIAHVDLLKEFAYVRKYDYNGVTISVELDEEGENWRPTRDLPLFCVVDNVDERLIELSPGETKDEKVFWLNNALYRAALDFTWESRPHFRISSGDQRRVDDLTKETTECLNDGTRDSTESLKKQFRDKWLERECPDIFR